jgi:hypothetical protein
VVVHSSAVLYKLVRRTERVAQYSIEQYVVAQYNTALHSAISCSTLQYSRVDSALQYSAEPGMCREV